MLLFDPFVRRVARLPHLGANRSGNCFIRHRASKTFLLRLFADGDCNVKSDLAYSGQRRKQVSARIGFGWTFCRDGVSGSEEHAIRYVLRTCRDRAESYAGIHIGIVRLIDAEGLAVALERRKWTAGADDGAALGPVVNLRGRRLTALGGIRERENNRLGGAARHLTHDLFREGIRLSRRPD